VPASELQALTRALARLLADHDPAGITRDNPHADTEYEMEARELARWLLRRDRAEPCTAKVTSVFAEYLDLELSPDTAAALCRDMAELTRGR
jgi:hypothetical protein